MPERPKRGRPPKAAADRKSYRLLLAMTQEQRARYEQAAGKQGQTLSEWMRAVCDQAAGETRQG